MKFKFEKHMDLVQLIDALMHKKECKKMFHELYFACATQIWDLISWYCDSTPNYKYLASAFTESVCIRPIEWIVNGINSTQVFNLLAGKKIHTKAC